MGLVQREQPQQKPSPAPVQEAAAEKKSRPTDLVPEENKQAAAKTEAPAPAAPEDEKKAAQTPEEQAAAKKEEERQAAVKAEWEGLLGKWLGGPLAKIVLEEVSVAKLNGYVKDGLGQAGPALGKALKGATKPSEAQEKGLAEFSTALSGVMTGLVDNWVKSDSGQAVLTKISHWVQDNPGWVMGIVGTALIGGAIAAWFANPDMKLDVPLKLGAGWEAKAGLDLGKLQQIGFQGASLVVANKNQAIKLGAGYSKKEEKGEDGSVSKTEQKGNLEVKVGKDEEQHAAFVMNGTITETKDGLVAHTLGGKLELVDPKTGAKFSVDASGKSDSKGNKENAFNYSAQAGTDVTGSFTCGLKDAVVVDEKGNIHTLSSQTLKVAVGDKAGKFKAEVSNTSESKDGKETQSTEISASAKGQLGAGALFETSGNVKITDDKVIVKLDGKMEATIGGKKVLLEGSAASDGTYTGKIRLGEGGEYKEIVGTKTGDTVTFATVDVFKGGKVESKMTNDGKGQVGGQTTATVDAGKGTTVTMSGGSEGNKVGASTKIGDNTTVSGNAGTDAKGQAEAGASVKYDTELMKFQLDAAMKDGKGSLGLSTSMATKEGFKFDGSLKLDDTRITEMAVKFGYKDPNAFRTFLVGYKRTWMNDNQQYADHFDALLEYSFGKFQARASGSLDLQGGKLNKTSLDLGGAYALNDKWKLIGGVQMNGMMNNDTNKFDQGFKPYVGAQYGGVGVAGYYDSQKKGGGIMLTIPF